MKTATIQSRQTDPGNGGNFNRDISFGVRGSFAEIVIKELDESLVHPKYSSFNISKKAALDLMTAIDLMLSEDDGEDIR